MKNTYQVIILGPGGVGKTRGTGALLKILSSRGFTTSEVKPWTEEMVVTSNYVIHNFIVPRNYFPDIDESLNISLYDMGGQFKYRDMWINLAEDTDAIIVCVDVTRKNTLKQVPLMLPKGIMQNVPVRLIVNKADLYADFSAYADQISVAIYKIIQAAVEEGLVNYKIKYRGTSLFTFGEKEYKYGDIIHVLRPLEIDKDGDASIKLADFEVITALAFKELIPNITEHNGNLFGREFTLQMFDVIYSWLHQTTTILDDDMIMTAHMEAPPFISWAEDPEIFLPKVNKISLNAIKKCVNSMLIEDTDLLEMIKDLREQGYNLDANDRHTWEFTSAHIMQEDPDLTYKPINKAMMPPYFIKAMIEYSESKEEDDYFF